MKIKFTWLILTTLTISCSPKPSPTSAGGKKVGQTEEVKNKNIDWEAFDPASSVTQGDINLQSIKGLWKAYSGVYRFGEYINAMKLTEPFIIEIKDSTVRRNLKDGFNSFTLKNNLLITTEGAKSDTGIINKITAAELTISWKDNLNYIRYYYKK